MRLTIKQAAELCGKTIQTVHYWLETGLESDWFRPSKMKPQLIVEAEQLETWLKAKGKKNVIKTLKKNIRNQKAQLRKQEIEGAD